MSYHIKPCKYNPKHRLLYTASDVPRFSPYSAQLMLTLAVQSERNKIAVIDPFVGNAVILSIAQLNFYEEIGFLYGSDINEEATKASNQNMTLYTDMDVLDERIRELEGIFGEDTKFITDCKRLRYFLARNPRLGFSIDNANAVNMVFEPSEYKRVIVTDPPYGKESRWIDTDDTETRESQLEKFLINVLNNNIKKVVLSFDNSQDLSSLLRKYFCITDVRKKNQRIIYLAYAK